MARTTKSDGDESRQRKATSPEEREAQLVNLAHDLAEEQIRNGTASSQVITHFLKLGSTREKLEQMRLEHENALTQAKIEGMESAKATLAVLEDAMKAFSVYQGNDPLETVGDDDED